MPVAEVKSLYDSNVRDIPTKLRELADEIEKGDAGCHGYVDAVAIVTNGEYLSVFGFGDATGTVAHLLFCAGARIIEQPFVERAR